MKNKITASAIINFPLTRILPGAAIIIFFVFISEQLRIPLNKLHFNADMIDSLIGIIQIILAISAYIILYSRYEKRKITELSSNGFLKYALSGFAIALAIQSLCVAVIYITNGYTILKVNNITSLFPGFIAAIIAGFIAEVLLRGILYRLMEEFFGTIITLIFFILLFFVLHISSKNATILSAVTVSLQAGFLISTIYIFSRSLWPAIFFHFAWDFSEPGIYGGPNPGIALNSSLFSSRITGNVLLTGGPSGPGNSLQSAIFCFITGLIFLWLIKKKISL